MKIKWIQTPTAGSWKCHLLIDSLAKPENHVKSNENKVAQHMKIKWIQTLTAGS